MNSELRTRYSHRALPSKERNAENVLMKHYHNAPRYTRHKKNMNLSRKAVAMTLPLLLYIVSTWTCRPFLHQKNIKPRIFLQHGNTNIRKQYAPLHVESNRLEEISGFNSIRSNVTLSEIQSKATNCVPLVEWQEYSFPTCNILHEIHLMSAEYTNSGMNRDVWMIKNANRENVAMKTLAMQHSFSRSMINKQRIDAIVSERSTSSDYIVDIYAYCKFLFDDITEDKFPIKPKLLKPHPYYT